MTTTSDRARRQLHALARSKGIEVRWRAQDGGERVCSDETLIAVLQALRVDVARPEDASRARVELARLRTATVVDPVAVAWDDARAIIRVRLPERDTESDFTIRAVPESRAVPRIEGEGEGGRWTRSELTVRVVAPAANIVDGVVELAVELPPRFSSGRYRIEFEGAHASGAGLLIAAPKRLPSVGSTRAWGVFAPVYALHTRGRAETGDLGAVDRLARWVHGRGGEIVGTLPILATFVGHGDEPCDPSPYAPVSRRYWNEVYLDLGQCPELEGVPAVVEPSPGPMVDLPRLAAARRPLLEAARRRLDDTPTRRAALDGWLDARPDVRAYAQFRSAAEGTGSLGAAVHEYAQWMMATQLADLSSGLDSRGQSLYIDLPIGTHRMGYDVAANPNLFVREASVGAPPDGFQANGQNWGFPPADPDAARAEGYAYFASCLAEQMQYARRLRLDHVMGLDRLWMIPPGAGAADGAYVHYAADEQWATVCLAAAQHGATVVGEDLGTVPPATDRALRRHRAFGMWVVEFELPDEEHVTADGPGGGVLACLDTHDLATFATWWHTLAPIPRGALLTALRAVGELDSEYGETISPEEVLTATLAWLGHSRAPIVLVALEDLWLETEPQNVPGAADQDTTFRQRAAFGLDEIDSVGTVKAALDALDRARKTNAARANNRRTTR